MRLAVYHHLPPGGALRSVVEVLGALPSGVTCDVFTLDTSQWWPFGAPGQSTVVPGRLSVTEVSPRRSSAWGRRAAPLTMLPRVRAAERQVAERINAGGYDAVLVHPCWLTQTPQILAHLDGPTAYYMHEPRRATFERGYRRRLRPRSGADVPRWVASEVLERRLRRDDRAAARWAPTILCNSYFTAEAIKRAYGADAQVCYLGVDPEVFTPGDEDRENVVLNVGGLEEFKGQHLLVEALGRVDPSRRPRLDLVYERADPVYRREVLDLARDLGVTVTEHRSVDDTTLARLYRTARATVLVASLEPFGLTMLESMASGTPVIAVREGGFREVVAEGVNGLLVDRDTEHLAEALDVLTKDELAWTTSAVRQSILPFWTWEQAARRQVDALGQMIGGAS